MNIWFTKGLANTSHAIDLIHEAYGNAHTIHASHTDKMAPVARSADLFFEEPKDRTGYADWVFDTARERGIDLIIVQRASDLLWPDRERFEAAGIRLHMTVSPSIRGHLDRKDLFGMELQKLGVPTPAFETFQTVEEFDFAVRAMECDANRVLADEGKIRRGLCVKPAVGMYGSGFRRLRDDISEMDMLTGNRFYEMSGKHFREVLSATPAREVMLLMRYLPGVERSVDFLARNGEFITGTARIKMDRYQGLEAEGPAIEFARKLTAHYGLNGICNLQTREDEDGQQHVLEINPRMSGGMQISCMSGVNLPAWDVALALDLRPLSELPAAIGGRKVAIRETPYLA